MLFFMNYLLISLTLINVLEPVQTVCAGSIIFLFYFECCFLEGLDANIITYVLQRSEIAPAVSACAMEDMVEDLVFPDISGTNPTAGRNTRKGIVVS